MASTKPTHAVSIPGSRLRRYAETLLRWRPPVHISPDAPQHLEEPPIRVVCISDTHNHQPDLPNGDILIHAGDLTEMGTVTELQAQLDWLSSQPHAHKVIVAGNHDCLLDEAFLQKHPRYRQDTETLDDLQWPRNVHYLQDNAVTVSVEHDILSGKSPARQLKISGSPWTPRYGISAFQYPPGDESLWRDRIPSDTDIVITHGPPRLHLDKRDFHRAGCPYLGQRIARVRPKLHVFGHIHVGYGREDVIFDSTRRRYEDIINFHSYGDYDIHGWLRLAMMAAALPLQWLRFLLAPQSMGCNSRRITTLVNASMVSGRGNDLTKTPIVVQV